MTWNDFVVENVWTWITVDWFVNWNVSWWVCELHDITATIKWSGSCEISGHDVIYKPIEWVNWEESCTITITDEDEEWSGDIEIEITFTWVDTLRPTVELQWWVWEQCTNENVFIVTWTFSEEVIWVTFGTLTWENVEIKWFNDIDWKVYEWIVEMQWWTWKVWILTWWITDNVWNELITWDEKILWNYDNEIPQWVTLLLPWTGQEFNRRTIDFEWTVSIVINRYNHPIIIIIIL